MSHFFKVILLLFCFQNIFIISLSQSGNPFVIKTFDEIKKSKGYSLLDAIITENNEVLRISNSGNSKFLFQLYSSELKLVKENISVSENILPSKSKYIGIIKLKTKTFLLFGVREKDVLSHLAIEFFEADLKIGTQIFKISETGDLKSLGMDEDNNYSSLPAYKERYSANRSLYMLVLKDQIYNKDEKSIHNKNTRLSMNVFDADSNQIWSKTFEKEDDYAISRKLDIAITNKSDILLLTKKYIGSNPDPKEGDPDLKLIIFKQNFVDPLIVGIEGGDYTVSDGKIYENEDGDIFLVGGYGKVPFTFVLGIYIFKLDKTSYKVIDSNFYEFPAEMIAKSVEDKDSYSLDNGLKMKSIYSMPDGSMKFILEVIHKNSFTGSYTGTHYTSSSQQYNYYVYYYGNIIVASINNKKLEWVKKISKSQEGLPLEDKFSLYSYAASNEINILYNDHIKNINKIQDGHIEKYVGPDEGYLAGVNIFSNGDVKKYNLIEKTPVRISDFKNGSGNCALNITRKKTVFIRK